MHHAIVVWLLAAAPAAGPSGPASLSCKAAGGVTLRGLIPATQAALELTLTDGSATVVMNAAQGDEARVVEALDDKVFTLVVTRKGGGELRLYALPRSVKARREAFAVHAIFDAVVVRVPQPGSKDRLTNSKMQCLYDYEV